MSECKCTMSVRVLGDGCRYCQPQGYIDRLHDWIDEARAEAEQAEVLAKRLDALRVAVEIAQELTDQDLHIDFETLRASDALTNYRKSKGE